MKAKLLFPVLLLCIPAFAQQTPVGWTDTQISSVAKDGSYIQTLRRKKRFSLKQSPAYKKPDVSLWLATQTIRYHH